MSVKQAHCFFAERVSLPSLAFFFSDQKKNCTKKSFFHQKRFVASVMSFANDSRREKVVKLWEMRKRLFVLFSNLLNSEDKKKEERFFDTDLS